MGVGSLNPSKAERSFGGTSSSSNERTGVMGSAPSGMWRVISFFCKNASASEDEAVGRDEEAAAEAEGSASEITLLLPFFLSFFSFLSFLSFLSFEDFEVSGSETASPAGGSATTSESLLRFFLSFLDSAASAATDCPSSASRFRFFFDFFSAGSVGKGTMSAHSGRLSRYYAPCASTAIPSSGSDAFASASAAFFLLFLSFFDCVTSAVTTNELTRNKNYSRTYTPLTSAASLLCFFDFFCSLLANVVALSSTVIVSG